jgi:ribosome maturation factor RimP
LFVPRIVDVRQVIESTAVGLGYELVDVELANHGRQLRVFIDRADGGPVDRPGPYQPTPGGDRRGVTLADCERVTRQLQRVLEVEGIDYGRLEVSSPGLDRVLKKPADFRRFAGSRAEVRLRVPRDGRRRFVGVLRAASDEGVDLEVDGAVVSFPFADMQKARLVPEARRVPNLQESAK